MISYLTVINFLLVSRNEGENLNNYIRHRSVNAELSKAAPGGQKSACPPTETTLKPKLSQAAL